MLLAFDTATPAVTVAVGHRAEVVAESTVVDPMRHGELLAPAINAVLTRAGISTADVDRIAVGIGPGPFTGLRVGLVTAGTMAAALGVPAVGVCTLDVVAAGVGVREPFLVASDARRKEVYWASYDEQCRRIAGPEVAKPATVATDRPVAGQGAVLYAEHFPHAVEPEYPRAADLARLVMGGAVEILAPEPLYLRRPDATPAHPPKPVS